MQNGLQMIRNFHNQGYPLSQLIDDFSLVGSLSRSDLLTPKPKVVSSKIESELKLFCITTYNPVNPPIQQIITKHWPILGRSSGTRLLVKAQIVFGHHRPRNLKDTLIKSRLPITDPSLRSPQANCLRPRTCKHCPQLDRSGKIISHSTGRTYKTETKVSCHSTNFIYCINWSDCGMQYVGQTKNNVIVRMNNHLSTIRLHEDLPVPNHVADHRQHQ